MCRERCAHLRAAHACVRIISATMCWERWMLLLAAHASVRPSSAVMCGDRGARLRAAYASVRLVSATMCRERCAHLWAALSPAHARVRPVSAIMCGVHCAFPSLRLTQASVWLVAPRLRYIDLYIARRVLRTSAGGTCKHPGAKVSKPEPNHPNHPNQCLGKNLTLRTFVTRSGDSIGIKNII